MKCREQKQLDLCELQSLSFQLKQNTPVVRVDLASGQTDSDRGRVELLEFKSAPRSTIRQDQVIISELELLSHVKIT